jgi:hypothetical protein
MLTTPLLCLALCGQVSQGRPNAMPVPESRPKPSSGPDQSEKRFLQIGSRPRIARSYVSVDLTGLNFLAYLTYYDTGTLASRKAAVEALAKEGMVIGLENSTKAIIQGVATDTDPTSKRDVMMYRARLLEGPSADRVVYFFESQIEGPIEDVEPPAPFDAEKREVYRLYRKAIAAAKVKAAQVHVSIRKGVLDREMAENTRVLAKQQGFLMGEMEEVVRLGEIDDGRADKRARTAVRADLRARNEMMLNALSIQLNAQIASVLQRAQAQAMSRSHFPPQYLQAARGPVIYGPLGHPLDKGTFIDGGGSVRPMR